MASGEHRPVVEGDRSGVSRRDALKKGAIAGGAVLWVSPFVQNIGISKAGATHTSPHSSLKDISFIAFLFVCGTTRYGVKLEFNGSGGYSCGNLPAPWSQGNDCGVANTGTEPSGCDRISVEVLSSNLVRVTLTTAGCSFVPGQAFSKCGSDSSTNTVCVPGTISGNTATFIGCPQN